VGEKLQGGGGPQAKLERHSEKAAGKVYERGVGAVSINAGIGKDLEAPPLERGLNTGGFKGTKGEIL